MRQLKFKVWDINKKVFIPNDVYAITNRTDFGAFGVMIKDWEDYREGEYFYDNAQILIEATGLTDKNGVDIYEGDIVKCTPTDRYPNDECISDIIFSQDYQWVVRQRHPDFPNDDLEHGLPIHWGGWKSLEVIGNIYEHAHLLNKTEPA